MDDSNGYLFYDCRLLMTIVFYPVPRYLTCIHLWWSRPARQKKTLLSSIAISFCKPTMLSRTSSDSMTIILYSQVRLNLLSLRCDERFMTSRLLIASSNSGLNSRLLSFWKIGTFERILRVAFNERNATSRLATVLDGRIPDPEVRRR